MNEARLLKQVVGAMVLCICLGPGSPGFAQTDDRSPAEALGAAVQLFEEGDYVGARHALMQIEPQELDEPGRARHTEYVQRAMVAVSMQEKADTDYEAAALAASEGRFDDARHLLQSILDNKYCSQDARAAAEVDLKSLNADRGSGPDGEGLAAQPAPAEQPAADLSGELRSLRAKVFTRVGYEALEAGRLSEAERLFKQALANVPGYPEAEQGLQKLGKYERVESGSQTLLERIGQRNSVAWQRTVATYRTLENEVRDHVLNNRFKQARQGVLRARQVVEGGRQWADPVSHYEALLHDAEALMRYVEEDERVFNERDVARQREEARRENQDRLRGIRENREKRINSLMSQALQLRKDRDFEAAINVLRQVTAVDPTNDPARWMMEGLEDQQAYLEQRALRDDFYKQSQAVLMDVDRSKVPWWKDVTYPKNWLEIISRPTRIIPGSENRGVDSDLQSRLDRPIRIDFQGDPFGEVMQRLAEAGDTNISVAWNDLAAASIGRDTPVNLTLNNPISLGVALREVLDNANGSNVEVGYLAADGLIKVATRALLDRAVYEEVYSVGSLLQPIPDFDDAPRMDLNDPATLAGGTRRVGGYESGRAVFPEVRDALSEEAIEEHANELVALIRKTINPESWRANGGDIGSITEINGQLVITQTPSGHARVGGLLSKLREQRAVQVAIEARFITVQSNYMEEMGLDLDIVLNSGNAGFDFISGGGGTMAVDPVLGSRLMLPRSFSRMGFGPSVPGVGSPLTAGTALDQPFRQVGLVPGSGNNFIGGRRASPLPVISNILQFTDPAKLSSDLPGSFAGNPTLRPAFSVFGSFLDNIQVDFLVRATQADARTTLVTAPRLVLFNGQRAWAAVFNQQSYVSSLQPVVDAQGQAPIIATLETGAVLDAQATVTADRRYVTMTLRPSVGRLLGVQTFGFSVGPNVGEGSFVQLPSITRTVIRTTVSVPDGGTLLIGGQKLSGEIEVESGVPILSKIPILKRLYSSRSLIKDEQVMLILIKPKIIIHSEAEQEAFPSFSSR